MLSCMLHDDITLILIEYPSKRFLSRLDTKLDSTGFFHLQLKHNLVNVQVTSLRFSDRNDAKALKV